MDLEHLEQRRINNCLFSMSSGSSNPTLTARIRINRLRVPSGGIG